MSVISSLRRDLKFFCINIRKLGKIEFGIENAFLCEVKEGV